MQLFSVYIYTVYMTLHCIFLKQYWVTCTAKYRSIHQLCNIGTGLNSSWCKVLQMYFECTSLLNLRVLHFTNNCKKPFSSDKMSSKSINLHVPFYSFLCWIYYSDDENNSTQNNQKRFKGTIIFVVNHQAKLVKKKYNAEAKCFNL